MSKLLQKFILLIITLSVFNLIHAAPRDVQIRSIDFTTGVVELFNFGTTDEILDGYRFCTHDEDQNLQYSSATGLNGVTITAGSSLFIHFNNDASGANQINISALGNFATPLDAGAYGMQIYFPPVSFGDGNTIADHVQWSIGGANDATAAARSDEAELGGVWTDQNLWVSTTADSLGVNLNDTSGSVLHGPDDYDVLEASSAVSVPFPIWATIISFAFFIVVLLRKRLV